MCPKNWNLSALTLFAGLIPKPLYDSEKIVLDVFSRTIEFQGKVIHLKSRIMINFLTLFACYGDKALPIKFVEQLDLESRSLFSERFFYSEWCYCQDESEVQIESRLNRVYVLKRKLNQILILLDLEVGLSDKVGYWSIYSKQSQQLLAVDILFRTDKNARADKFIFPHVSTKINSRDNVIWHFCVSRDQYFSHKSLAIEMTQNPLEADLMGATEISKILNYFEKKVLKHSNYKLISDRKGHYFLTDKELGAIDLKRV